MDDASVFSRPECPFNYCDTKSPHDECRDKCRHLSGESQGNSEERAFRKAMSKPAEVWYPCGCKASPGSPKHCPEHSCPICHKLTIEYIQGMKHADGSDLCVAAPSVSRETSAGHTNCDANDCRACEEESAHVKAVVGNSLLHKADDKPPNGCYCPPGKCGAPVIMGRQMPCRDPQKAKAEPVPYCLLIQDLAMLVRRLIRKHPNLKLAAQATDFLRRKGLQGNILRTAQDNIGNGELPEAAPLSGEGGERKITPEAAYHNKYGSEAPRGYCCENGNFEDGHKCMKQPGAVAAQGPSPKESIMHRAFDYQQPATPYGELKERLSAQGQKDQTGDGDKLLAEYDRAFDRVSAFGAGRDDRDAWLKPRAEILKRLRVACSPARSAPIDVDTLSDKVAEEIRDEAPKMHGNLHCWPGTNTIAQKIREIFKPALAALPGSMPTQPDWMVWEIINRERGRLIGEKISNWREFTPIEERQLAALQAYADAHLEEVAPRPTGELERLEAKVSGSLPSPAPPKKE